MKIQGLINILNWFPENIRKEKDIEFVTTEETRKTGAQIEYVRYYPDHDHMDIEIK